MRLDTQRTPRGLRIDVFYEAMPCALLDCGGWSYRDLIIYDQEPR